MWFHVCWCMWTLACHNAKHVRWCERNAGGLKCTPKSRIRCSSIWEPAWWYCVCRWYTTWIIDPTYICEFHVVLFPSFQCKSRSHAIYAGHKWLMMCDVFTTALTVTATGYYRYHFEYSLRQVLLTMDTYKLSSQFFLFAECIKSVCARTNLVNLKNTIHLT